MTPKEAFDAVQETGDEAALASLERMADDGQSEALHLLGFLYWLGEQVPLDHARAKHLLAEAAALGDVLACHNLAMFYASGGPGEPPNWRKARVFHERAVALGFPMPIQWATDDGG
jgi:TPR repeat protein